MASASWTFKILYQNQFHKDMMGVHIGEFCYKAYTKRQGICGGCPVALTFKDGKAHTVQRELQTDKEIRYAEITASPLKDSTGKIIAGIEVVRDITEQKHAEEALKQSELKYNNIIRTTQDGFWYVDTDGRFLDVNDAACKMLGYERGELLKMKISDIEVIEDKADVIRHIAKMRYAGGDRFETKHKRKDGTIVEVEVTT